MRRLLAPAAAAALLVALLVIVVVLLERLARTALVLGLAAPAAGLVQLGLLQVRIRSALAIALRKRDFELVDLVPLGIRARTLGNGEQFLEPLPRRRALVRRGRRRCVRVLVLVVVFRINGCSLPVCWFMGGSSFRGALHVRPSLGAFQNRHGGGDEACRVIQVRRNNQRIAGLGQLLERIDIELRHLQVGGAQAFGRADGRADDPYGLGLRLSY